MNLQLRFVAAISAVAVFGLPVFGQLTLRVTTDTGITEIVNTGLEELDFDGYSIASPTGQLGNDTWTSLTSQGLSGWDVADNSDSARVTEFNPTSESSIAGGESISLGALYAPDAPAKIGDVIPRDLSFSYTSPTGMNNFGDVEYFGALNNIVLTIDPTTGAATIQNQSPFFDAAIDGYTITSTNGVLNSEAWKSLESQGIPNWDAADNSDQFRLTEFNPTAETQLAGGGTILDLGNAFDVSNALELSDLSFEYLVAGGTAAEGLVLISEIGSTCMVPAGFVLGDFDSGGAVDFADFLTLSRNFGTQVSTYEEGDADCSGTVDFTDFLTLSGNFGKTGAPAGAAVPEPSSMVLLFFGFAGLTIRRSRK